MVDKQGRSHLFDLGAEVLQAGVQKIPQHEILLVRQAYTGDLHNLVPMTLFCGEAWEDNARKNQQEIGGSTPHLGEFAW